MVSVAIFSPGLKHPGLFLYCIVQRLTWYFRIFYNFLGGGACKWRYLNPVFEKCDLRVWNSVHVRYGTPLYTGVVGDGWGSAIPKTTYPKPPIWILKVLISNSAEQQRGKVSPSN
jgi:hypothetical protein